MMLLNQWDPAHGADKDFRFYQVEAEEIAQQIRKNSKLESIEKVNKDDEVKDSSAVVELFFSL